MEATQFLLKITTILKNLSIPYIITGGIAVSVWGRPRFTADVDIVIELLPKNISGLTKELLILDKDVYVDEETIFTALKNKGEFNFIHPQSGLKADFWIVKDEFNKQEIKRAIAKEIDGQKISFVSPEDLILSKLQWYKLSNSTRQIEDIQSVIKISKIDIDYVKKWATKQGTIDNLEKLL